MNLMKNTSYKTETFLILTENIRINKNLVKEVSLAKEMIGFVFYASGSMSINVSLGNRKSNYIKKQGIASSFYYSPSPTRIEQVLDSAKPISKLSIFIEPAKLKQLLGEDQKLNSILKPNEPFIEGNSSFLNHDMYSSIHKMMNCEFSGVSKNLILESQAIELLANYLNQIGEPKHDKRILSTLDIDKLQFAKELILSRIETPPTINELSQLCGLNTFKLKKGFKDVFGLPVYQYIKNEKMELAFKGIQNKENTIQEAAWSVGYSSLGSFSNAFYKKFGIRPSSINK